MSALSGKRGGIATFFFVAVQQELMSRPLCKPLVLIASFIGRFDREPTTRAMAANRGNEHRPGLWLEHRVTACDNLRRIVEKNLVRHQASGACAGAEFCESGECFSRTPRCSPQDMPL
jgi:hypothetical protein